MYYVDFFEAMERDFNIQIFILQLLASFMFNYIFIYEK